MREFAVEIGGREYTLAATFKASLEIAEKVGDPLTIMREAALEAMFIGRGLPYEPKWRFTVENTVEILHIGLKTAGNKMRREELQDLVFDMGFAAAKEIAGDYLALIAGPRPQETVESSGEPKGN